MLERFAILTLVAGIYCSSPYAQAQDAASTEAAAQEALFVRRIVEFWKDQDFSLAKAQIYQFLEEHPDSEYTDSLLAILGDILLGEGCCEEAFAHYSSIKNPALQAKVAANAKYLLLTLAAQAYQANNLDGMDKWSAEFEKTFKEDPSNAQMLYLRALTYLNTDHYEKARQCLERIIERYPNFDKMEPVIYEHALLLAREKKWLQARQELIQFSSRYPQSKHFQAALQQIMNISYQQLEEEKNAGNAGQAIKEQLIGDLHLVLDSAGELPDNLRARCKLQIAKLLFELNRYQEALISLETFLKEQQGPEEGYQAHLLMSLIYRDLCDTQNFAYHAEQMLALQPASPDSSKLHLNLFNAYSELYKTVEDLENLAPGSKAFSPYADLAARHLYEAFKAQEPIKAENQLWLANRFYSKIREQQDEYEIMPLQDSESKGSAACAAEVLEHALQISREGIGLKLQPLNVSMEAELLKLSNLYGWLGDRSAQIQLLSEVERQYKTAPDVKWTLKNRAAFALAEALRAEGKCEEAIEFYAKVVASKTADLNLMARAKLSHARLSYRLIPEKSRSLNNSLLVSLLKTLKDLQIRKSIEQEPCHLEAAFEYAFIRSALEPAEKQKPHLLALMRRLKEDFTSEEDICSKDYAAGRRLNPAKDRLFQAYMALAEAHIARLESSQAGDPARAAARELYGSLVQSARTPFLIEQAQKGLRLLEEEE